MIALLIALSCIVAGLFVHNCLLSEQNLHLRNRLDSTTAQLDHEIARSQPATQTRAALVRARLVAAGKTSERVVAARAMQGGAQ